MRFRPGDRGPANSSRNGEGSLCLSICGTAVRLPGEHSRRAARSCAGGAEDDV